ncbi:hypothetical protein GCM10009527_051680 [Actinomadura nitritigenes]
MDPRSFAAAFHRTSCSSAIPVSVTPATLGSRRPPREHRPPAALPGAAVARRAPAGGAAVSGRPAAMGEVVRENVNPAHPGGLG